MRRRVLECSVLVGWELPKLDKPKKCAARARHFHHVYALPVCDKHIAENARKGFTLVQHEGTGDDPTGVLVGIGQGSRYIKRQ